MAGYPPGVPPVPPVPPPGYDPRAQHRYMRDQARAQRAAWRAHRDQIRYQMRAMRRGSVLGPILLIVVGVVFLLIETGHIDRNRFWEWYGHWWPLLLVAAGLVVLAEWALDQFNMRDPERPAYRRSIGGGVITMLVILGIAGVVGRHVASGEKWDNGAWHIGPDNLDEFFGDKHESDQSMDLAFPAGSTLAIVNPLGDVTISGTSDDDRIHLAVHKQVYARSDADADSKARQLVPSTATSGSQVTITMPSIDGTRADLVLQVPAAAASTVTANHGDIHIASIKAPVFATANHGDIELSGITGVVTAHINNDGSSISAHSMGSGIAVQGHANDITLSDITGPVTLTGEFFGTTHLERINGAIHFHTSRTDFQLARLDGEVELSAHGISADQALGPVVLTTSNRNVSLDRLAGDIAITNKNGNIDLTAAPSLGTITLEDRNGSIKATLPEKAGFSVEAGTTNGDTYTDFSLFTHNNDSHKSISGTVGAGGPTVRITTANGDVSILKADVPPLAPTPPVAPKITLAPTPPAAPKPPAARAKKPLESR